MEALQEKILKIIKNKISAYLSSPLSQQYDHAAKEITTLIEEGYYEKDFVEFTRIECEGMNEGWQYYKKVNSIQYFGTTDELYEHWQKEIRTSN